MTYLPFIDGLRAVAILAVVAYHALPASMPGGFVGVDVFFVISGFLITRFIASEMTDGTFSLANFYVRRARRLLPAAIVCFLVIAVLAGFVLLPDAYWYYGRSLLSAILMYANLFFYNTGGYFSAPSLEKPLLHTWSLSVEDQFYLTWPLLLLMLLPRISRAKLVVVAAVIAIASLVFAEAAIARDPEFAFFQLPARAWELLAGASIALLGPRVLHAATANIVALIGAVAICASFALLSSAAHFPGLGALAAVAGTAAIIYSSQHQKTLISRALAWKPVVFIGLISYSLYLWHWPLIALWSYHLERPLDVSEAVIVVALSFAIAIVSWRFVERPFRHGLKHDGASLSASDTRFVIGALGGVVAVIGVAMALKVLKGVPERYTAEVQTALVQMVSGNPVRGTCDNFQNVMRNDAACNLGRKKAASESYDVALFGDSMADHWTPLVAKFAEERQLSFRQVTNGGCALLFGVDIPARPAAKAHECKRYQEEAEKFIAANPKLKLAVISAFWEKWLGRIERPDDSSDMPRDPSGGDASPKFDKVLSDTIAPFTSRGIKVVLIGQIPTYDTLHVRCIVTQVRQKADPAVCGMTREEADRQLQRSDAALKRAAALPGVTVSLPSAYMCQSVRCSPIADGTLLYKNGGHVNRFGAEYLRRFIEFPTLP